MHCCCEVDIIISVAQNIALGHRTCGWQTGQGEPTSHGSFRRENGGCGSRNHSGDAVGAERSQTSPQSSRHASPQRKLETFPEWAQRRGLLRGRRQSTPTSLWMKRASGYFQSETWSSQSPENPCVGELTRSALRHGTELLGLLRFLSPSALNSTHSLYLVLGPARECLGWEGEGEAEMRRVFKSHRGLRTRAGRLVKLPGGVWRLSHT